MLRPQYQRSFQYARYASKITSPSILIPCGHKFDQGCIFDWSKVVDPNDNEHRPVACPLCRREAYAMQIYNLAGELLTFDLGKKAISTQKSRAVCSWYHKVSLDDDTFFNHPRVTPEVASRTFPTGEPHRLISRPKQKGRVHRGLTRKRRLLVDYGVCELARPRRSCGLLETTTYGMGNNKEK